MTDKYILDENGEPQPEPDLMKWAEWFEKADRTVAKTQIAESKISTVFLGLDHSFGESGAPILYETMVFGGKLDDEQDRYATRAEAEQGHRAMTRRVHDAILNEPLPNTPPPQQPAQEKPHNERMAEQEQPDPTEGLSPQSSCESRTGALSGQQGVDRA